MCVGMPEIRKLLSVPTLDRDPLEAVLRREFENEFAVLFIEFVSDSLLFGTDESSSMTGESGTSATGNGARRVVSCPGEISICFGGTGGPGRGFAVLAIWGKRWWSARHWWSTSISRNEVLVS